MRWWILEVGGGTSIVRRKSRKRRLRFKYRSVVPYRACLYKLKLHSEFFPRCWFDGLMNGPFDCLFELFTHLLHGDERDCARDPTSPYVRKELFHVHRESSKLPGTNRCIGTCETGGNSGRVEVGKYCQP